MLKGYHILVAALLPVAMFAISCGGGGATAPAPEATSPDVIADGGFPALPEGSLARESTILNTGGVLDGDNCVAFHNGTLISGQCRLEAGTEDDFGWALYQVAEPVDPPHAITVNAWYVDPYPDLEHPRKGYWVAYGNYTDNRWEIAGPFLRYESRIFFPEGMDVVSPGGFINFIVFCEYNQQVNVEYVSLGTDAGFGYEETTLGYVHGSFIGEVLELQVDDNEDPHFLYTTAPSMINRDDVPNTMHVKYINDAGLQSTVVDVGTIEEYRWARLAVGSGGRRAVLVSSESPDDDLYLFYDDGGGTFAAVGSVATGQVTRCLSGITFVNSADDPLGDRDLLVFTYAKYTASPITQSFYRTYDGVALGPETPLYPLVTRRCGRLSLDTGPNNEAVAGVPSEAGGDWRYYVGTYSAVADVWDFATITSWIIPEVAAWDSGDLDYRPDFTVRAAQNGDIIAGYLTEEDEYIRTGLWDGLTWESTGADRVPWASGLMENYYTLDVFTTGTAATIAPFGSMSPMLAFGKPGSGNDWFRSYLSLEPYSMIQGALAIDGSNNVHMACVDYFSGGLVYYLRDAVTTDIHAGPVDFGGTEPGYCSGFCYNVMVGDRLNVFYVDEANARVCRSVNRGGVWEVEHENILGEFAGAPYMLYGAGYLPGENLLWVLFMDYMTMSSFCVSGPPDGSDWQTHQFAGFTQFPASAIDNGTEIGLVVPAYVMGGGLPAFYHGGPRDGPHSPEILTMSMEGVGFPFYLGYNEFIGQWNFVSGNSDNDMVNYFLRAPEGGWIGPFIVCDESPGGIVNTGGISVSHEDGTTRITIARDPAGGPDETELWIYSAPNGSAVFTPTSHFMTIDNTVDHFGMLVTTPTANGEPLVAAMYIPGGDPTMDVRFFRESSPDTWTSLGVWDTTAGMMYLDLGLNAGGGIICSGVEMMDPDRIGRVVVYYPWE